MRRAVPLIAAFALVAAACTSSDGASSDSTVAAPTTTSPTGPDTSGATQDAPTNSTAPSGLTMSVASGWTATSLGSGVKPVVALDGGGVPSVAWILERIGDGFIAFAGAADGWSRQLVLEGYFYGPIGLAFAPDDTPNIAIHDHQADGFDPELGDLVRLSRVGDRWEADTAHDDGHDGWDSTIVVGADGIVHAAGVDPVQFGREEGIEYYRNDGGVWEVVAIGSGPVPYQYNVSLALQPTGSPAITYYDANDADLVFAALEGDSWALESVATEGDVGKYSSLAFDRQGRAAVTFFEQTGGTQGNIVLAVDDGDGWSLETVGSLTGFSEGNARRNSSLAFDTQGRAHVAYSDTTGVWYAIRDETGWQTEQIVTADLPLGQLVSLVLDGTDTPHLALYEVTSSSPLEGTIAYLTRP